jgi:PHD/YefM family antitoxin component YafN of YafNO toxin-antitoxin module
MRNVKMQGVPQVKPISNLARDHKALLRLIGKGPVYLTQRSEPVAVMVSASQWDETAKLIEDLQAQLGIERRLRLSNQRYAEAQADPSLWVSPEEYEHGLQKAGLTDHALYTTQ